MTEDQPKRNPPMNLLGMYTSVDEVVLGHYQILGEIARGGMGQVYKGRDLTLGRDVALKFLPSWNRGNPEHREQLVREAKAASALNHPGIVTIYEFAEHDGVNFIVMEYIEGHSLDQLIPETGLPAELALYYGLQIAVALAAAHERGLLHGDLKPQNIMVTDRGRVKLLDFGLAKSAGPASGVTREESEGKRFGTSSWLPPEQLAPVPPRADERTEIFTFGLILHQMLSGVHPFGPGGRDEVKAAILNATPTRLSGEVPVAIVAVIDRCLAKKPEGRFDSTRDLLNALRDAGGFDARGHPRVSELAPPPSLISAVDLKHIQTVASNITGANVARSKQALKTLVTLVDESNSKGKRQAAILALKDAFLSLGDERSGPARTVRKLVLALLKKSTQGRLAALFDASDLEDLDLYEADFASAQLAGISFSRSFLTAANFRAAVLRDSSFANTWVRNVIFTDADLSGADLTDADWFNASGLKAIQLTSVRRHTVRECPPNTAAMHRFLEARYGIPIEAWPIEYQDQIKASWQEYLRPDGLRDLVAAWRRTNR